MLGLVHGSLPPDLESDKTLDGDILSDLGNEFVEKVGHRDVRVATFSGLPVSRAWAA
jgi:hypothetical protein